MGCIKGIPHGAQIGRRRPVNTELMYGGPECKRFQTCFDCEFIDCNKRQPLSSTIIREINDIEPFLSIKTGGCDYESSCKSCVFKLSCRKNLSKRY